MTGSVAKINHFLGQSLRRAPAPVQDVAREGAVRILGALGATNEDCHQNQTQSVCWVSPPLPVPEGLSVDQLESSFRTWSVNGDSPGALGPYVDDSMWRFLHTWGMVQHDVGTCLEIGSNPYFTTYLLEEHTRLDVTLSNYYGHAGEATETVSFVPPGAANRIDLERRSQLFNVEEDAFPFDTDTFDIVLFCETIEHLLMDPVAALREIHRVLKPFGVIILTTPNVARLSNVMTLVEGGNIYDPYSGYGPYGRHNREYNRDELHRLLKFAGFDVDYSLTADGHSWDPTTRACFSAVAPTIGFRSNDLGQYIFVRAHATRPPQSRMPSFLYRSWPEGEIVPY